jgi:hypothetical protein
VGGKTRQQIAFGISIPSSPINSPEPVLQQADRGEEDAERVIQLWVRDWMMGGEGLVVESIRV